jgi:hypothetical protein
MVHEGEIKVLDDAELVAGLDRMTELREAADEYASLEKPFKAAMKARAEVEGGGMYVAGDYMIRTKVGETTRYDMPPEIKKQYATKSPMVRTTWERID